MQFKKAIISFVLLIAYTMGFSHGLASNCTIAEFGNEVSNGNNHHHMHHEHVKGDAKDHDHFMHEDHFDEGLFDYFKCVWTESEHDDGIDHTLYISNSTAENSMRWDSDLICFITLFDLQNDAQIDLDYAEFNPEISHTYLSPTIGDSPQRGPPTFSC